MKLTMKMRPANSICCSHAYQSPVVCVLGSMSECTHVCESSANASVKVDEQSLISLSSIFIATSTFVSRAYFQTYIHDNIIHHCVALSSALSIQKLHPEIKKDTTAQINTSNSRFFWGSVDISNSSRYPHC